MSLVTLNNRALKDATAVGTTTGLGNLVFISRATASSSSSLSITSGIDSTYKEYIFFFNNMHPATDNVSFQFNGTDDTSSHSFDITKTTTAFQAYHSESDSEASLGYRGNDDVAQGTGYHTLMNQVSNDADANIAGYLHLFETSNTTFVKHFLARISGNNEDNHAQDGLSAGYFNTTAAITGLDFKFSSGNIDSGTIDMYGVN
jgi:hypothetical protein